MDNKRITVLVGEVFYRLSLDMDNCIHFEEWQPFDVSWSKGITPRFDNINAACLWAKLNCF